MKLRLTLAIYRAAGLALLLYTLGAPRKRG